MTYVLSTGYSLTSLLREAIQDYARWIVRKAIKPPKNWRWFHVFACFVAYLLPHSADVPPQRRHRVQERMNHAQRLRHKRRAFVQGLAT